MCKEDLTRDFERCYLGSLLIAIDDGETVAPRLKAVDFGHKDYGDTSGAKPNIVTLSGELPGIPTSEISDLTTAIPSSDNIAYYEEQILKASKRRRLAMALGFAGEALEKGADTEEIISGLLPALDTVNAKNGEPLPIQDNTRTMVAAIVLSGLYASGENTRRDHDVQQAIKTADVLLGALENPAPLEKRIADWNESRRSRKPPKPEKRPIYATQDFINGLSEDDKKLFTPIQL